MKLIFVLLGALFLLPACKNPGTKALDSTVLPADSDPTLAQIDKDCAVSQKLVEGWAIGNDASDTAVILHTDNGGRTWREQGDKSRWTGFSGNGISAVDNKTAWAAVGSNQGGKILHTRDGGVNWVEQKLPAGVGFIKGVKGLSRLVAWAVTLDGIVVHTRNGGAVWSIVPHPSVTIKRVNRISAIGPVVSDVWIADEDGGRWGMIHSLNNGKTWRKEFVNYSPSTISTGLHMIGPSSRSIVWSASWENGELFRTVNGGTSWVSLGNNPELGPNDIDDMCSPSSNTLWGVQNLGTMSFGKVFRARLVNGKLTVDSFYPDRNYSYSGVSCVDDLNALAVGLGTGGPNGTLPKGIIAVTKDGGKTWASQPIPVSDVRFWKVSFVGAAN